MPTTAHAVVVTAPGELSVAKVELGELGPRDILIRTLVSGVSTGTDKWVMQGKFTWTTVQFPAVPGYQRFGIVEALGSDVHGFELGQEVVATASRDFVDACSAWGGHVSLAYSDCGEVYSADGLNPERASLFISGQVGVNAASRVPHDQRVVVYGDGIIGASGALAAKARGCQVLLVGRHPERTQPIAGLGITTVRAGDDSADAVRDWQPTAVIDTVQNDEAFAEYVEVLPERTGLIVFSGHSPSGTKAWANMERMQQRELTAAFVSGWASDRIADTLALMRDGALPLELFSEDRPATEREIETTMRRVAAGSLAPVAATLDWRGLQ